MRTVSQQSDSPVDDLKRRRGLAWTVLWRLKTIWHSKILSIATKLRLFVSLVVAIMSYGSETWPINAEMTWLMNSFATSAYRVMTSVKRMDKFRNSSLSLCIQKGFNIHSTFPTTMFPEAFTTFRPSTLHTLWAYTRQDPTWMSSY